jgi:hypothetical protein
MLRLDDLFIESFQVKDGNSFRNVWFFSKELNWRSSFQMYWSYKWRKRKD